VDEVKTSPALFLFRRQEEMEALTQLYDVNTAAQMLAVSPWTVRAYIRNGKLRPVRFGRLVRLENEEMLRFIADAKACRETAAIKS
jgi:excisionase family DNA binding protein